MLADARVTSLVSYVTGNGVGADGAMALAGALQENSSLTALDVGSESECVSVCGGVLALRVLMYSPRSCFIPLAHE